MSSIFKSKQVAWTLLQNTDPETEAITMEEVEYTIGAHANDVSIVSMSRVCDNIMVPPVKASEVKTQEQKDAEEAMRKRKNRLKNLNGGNKARPQRKAKPPMQPPATDAPWYQHKAWEVLQQQLEANKNNKTTQATQKQQTKQAKKQLQREQWAQRRARGDVDAGGGDVDDGGHGDGDGDDDMRSDLDSDMGNDAEELLGIAMENNGRYKKRKMNKQQYVGGRMF